jgi:hypothetical protein
MSARDARVLDRLAQLLDRARSILELARVRTRHGCGGPMFQSELPVLWHSSMQVQYQALRRVPRRHGTPRLFLIASLEFGAGALAAE